MSIQTSRNYLAVTSAIIIAGVLISASLILTVGGAKTITTTITETSVSTTSLPEACSLASNHGLDMLMPFQVVVSYSGPWNATLIAYSGPGAVFTQCYVGSGTNLISLNDWNPNGSALLQVSAQKIDGSSGNLTLTINGKTNSTVAPYGSVSVSAGPQT